MIYLERTDTPGERTILREAPPDPGILATMRADCAVGLVALRSRLSTRRLPGASWFIQPPPADKSQLESYPLVLTGSAPPFPAATQRVDLALTGCRMFPSGLIERVRFVLLEPLPKTAQSIAFPLGRTALHYTQATPDSKKGVASMVYDYYSDGLVEISGRLQPLPDSALREEFTGVWEALALGTIAPLPDSAQRLVIEAEQVNGAQLQALSDYLVTR